MKMTHPVGCNCGGCYGSTTDPWREIEAERQAGDGRMQPVGGVLTESDAGTDCVYDGVTKPNRHEWYLNDRHGIKGIVCRRCGARKHSTVPMSCDGKPTDTNEGA